MPPIKCVSATPPSPSLKDRYLYHLSDGRYKFKVQEDVKGLDFILQLRPVTYQFDVKRFDAQYTKEDAQATQGGNIIQASYDEAALLRRSGFIAQEVEKAANTSGYNFSGIIKPRTDKRSLQPQL